MESFCELFLKTFISFLVLSLTVYYRQPSHSRVLFWEIKRKLSRLRTVSKRGNTKETQKFVVVKIGPVFKTNIFEFGELKN